MAEDKLQKSMMAIMMVVIMAAVMLQVVEGAQPAPPSFECPLDDEVFYTYDELSAHFISAHPTQPIDIIWDPGG